MKVNEEVMDQENGQENEDDIGLFDDDQADKDNIIILEDDEADFSKMYLQKYNFVSLSGSLNTFFPFVQLCTRFLFYNKLTSSRTSRSFLNFLLFSIVNVCLKQYKM